MRIKQFKNKSYTHFFISYLAILFIPIFVITLILSKTVFNILETEIQNRDRISLNHSSYLLDNNLASCLKISDNLISQDNIVPFKFKDDIVESMRVINILNKYTATNNFFDKIYIHFFEDEYVYSGTSSYTLKRFYKEISDNSDFINNLSKIITSIKTPTFITPPDKNNLYYSVPYIINGEVSGSIIFSINIKTVNSIINSSGPSRYLCIFDNDDNIINLSNINTFECDDIKNYILSIKDTLSKDKSFLTTIDDYSLFFDTLPSVNLHILCITTSTSLFSELSHVTNLLIITILLSFILGCVAIFVLLKFNYKPINRLKELSKKLHIEGINNSYYNEYNEFDLIENTLRFLTERNTELEYEFSKNISLMQSVKLNELINGIVSDSNRFLKDCAELGLNLTAKYHVIVLIKVKNLKDVNITSLSEILTKYNIPKFTIDYEFLVNTFINELNVFLVGINSSSISLPKKQQLDEHLILSIGSIQEDINLLAKSYIDARTNLEFSNNNENNTLIKDFISKYDDILQEVNILISNNNINEAYLKISSLLLELQKEQLPFKLIRSVYFELIIMYNNYIDKNKHSLSYNHIDLSVLYQIKTLDELNDVFKEISSELIQLIKNKASIEPSKLSIEKIQEYVLENYTDYSFSLQLVSDKFNVSSSYLSQYFKDKTGITMLDYITNLKMNKAKDLLITTNLTLKDISDQIGYSNISSFIRRFKQVTSMTPGEFKRNHLNEKKL